jgi:hypothetical protein
MIALFWSMGDTASYLDDNLLKTDHWVRTSCYNVVVYVMNTFGLQPVLITFLNNTSLFYRRLCVLELAPSDVSLGKCLPRSCTTVQEYVSHVWDSSKTFVWESFENGVLALLFFILTYDPHPVMLFRYRLCLFTGPVPCCGSGTITQTCGQIHTAA